MQYSNFLTFCQGQKMTSKKIGAAELLSKQSNFYSSR